MPKLRVFSARELCDLLQEHGFAQTRQSGSHLVMRKQTTDGGAHCDGAKIPAKFGVTLKSIIEQGGLPSALFMN